MPIERLLRIPPPPEPPAGSPESVRCHRPAPAFYRYRLLTWGLSQVGAAIGLIAGFTVVDFAPDFGPDWMVRAAEILGAVGFVVQLPFTFVLVRLDVKNRWYLVTDRSLRIREGVVHVREQTMSFANVQNLSIRQGPLQRLFGIADLRVRTAGGGGGGDEDIDDLVEGSKNLHLGHLRGLERPREIRDTILLRSRHHRDAGLGDPDGPTEADAEGSESPSAAGRPQAVAAARELVAEARSLRWAMEHRVSARG